MKRVKYLKVAHGHRIRTDFACPNFCSRLDSEQFTAIKENVTTLWINLSMANVTFLYFAN